MRATVLVRPKPGILDPQGQAVSDALRHLGFDVTAARVGRLVELHLPGMHPATARPAIDRMCEQLLVNPLIETYEVTLDADAPTEAASV